MTTNMAIVKTNTQSLKKSFLLLVAIGLFFSFSNYNPATYEMPVMKINFYMMGMDEIDESITVKIGQNVERLNQEFEGQIIFDFEELYMDPNGAYLPDLHRDYYSRHMHDEIETLIAPIEKAGGINIFLFDTYCQDGMNTALMGFTPVFKARHDTYSNNSPRFDRIFLAYQGLENQVTLVHEMGHFLGLKHPWEMSVTEKYKMGLHHVHAESVNHMTYNSEVHSFTRQQLDKMRNNALSYRTYLMKRIVSTIRKA